MNPTGKLAVLSLILVLASCATQKPYYNPSLGDWRESSPGPSSELSFEIYLIGDSRRAYENQALTDKIGSRLKQAGENSAVIFLGDNVQSAGLPDEDERHRELAERSLDANLKMVDGFRGRIFFLPGNHDWARGGRDGLEHVKNQRKYIEKHLDKKNVFLPPKGRPGPEEIHLTDDIVLIVFDSQWWFQQFDKSYDGIEDEADLFVQLEDAVSRNRDKKIIVATHHPIYSVGNHGGHFPGSSLLFPLLEINPALYFPLPGFLYTGYRKFLGGGQDLANPQYKLLKEALLETFEGQENIIYAAGHEHNLQYVKRDGLHQIISGAAGMSSYVARSDKTDFAEMNEGFARLAFYGNGDVWLEMYNLSEKPAFRTKLYNKPPYQKERIEKYLSGIDYSDSTLITHPHGEKFRADKLKRVFFGDNYRDEWMIPVEVPVFDFNHREGGLEIVKKGGGGQTKSLRLENGEGRQWVLRSLDKDPSKVIPEVVKMQLAIDLAQDQMSAYLPWAALSVPRLADAAGIYHTNPEIVYLTRDPRLGAYRDDVWEGLYLFEERPNGDRRDVASFGRSKDIIGTPDLFEEIEDDHDNRVDQEHFLKCRLFDVFIGDWDRHEDQWRWAGFKEGDGWLYRAVPRDRDQTFFLNEGFFPWISSRKFALRMNQGFDYDIRDMGGLISQGKWLDRRFLNELPKEEWIRTAERMQAAFTDQLLTDAVYDMPPQIAKVKGKTTIAKLKSRREQLPAFAEEFYSIISKKVDVVGSDKNEQFQVRRINDKETEVKVWSLNSDGKKKDKIYDRTFRRGETREIRLYGLKGEDEFDVEGKVNKGILVRIVGGPGKDDIRDKSEVRGPGKRTIIYDTRKKNKIEFGSEARNRTSRLPEKNQYTYDAFKYNKYIPLAYLGFNADESLVLGAGLLYTTYGFQKSPYASHHSLGVRFASATDALELEYKGKFTALFGRFDLDLNFMIRDPRYSHNYFGLGNETQKTTEEKDYNRVRIGQIHLNPSVSRTFKRSTFTAGIFYQQFDVENTAGRYIADLPANGLSPEIFERQRYAGINLSYELDSRDNRVMPTRGLYWKTSTLFNYSLSESARTYDQLASDLSFYLSFRKPNRAVFAFRFGGAINAGHYRFYQACSIGGNQNLRGYRADRYAGDACVYQNTEFRYRLFSFTTYIAKGEFGLIGFNDIGRVWLAGENSGVWHDGYGGGIWISPFSLTAVTATYERSKDEVPGLFTLRFSFLF